jgi:hypothetical protein
VIARDDLSAGVRLGMAIVGAVVFSAQAAAESPGAAAQTVPVEIQVRSVSRVALPSVEMRVGAEEARRGAGTQGDAIKALQALPGTARAGAGAGEVIAWGSPARETRLYVDGVEIPALYHGSGIRSVLPSGWVAQLTFLPGAYGVDYGRGVGGVVALETRRLDPERTHAGAQLDLLDAGASLSARLSPRVQVGAAFRHSLIDRWLPEVTHRDVESVLALPRYSDAQAKLAIALAEQESLEVVYLGSSDRAVRRAPANDGSSPLEDTRRLSFERWFLRYRQRTPGRELEVTPFFGLDDRMRQTTANSGVSRLDLNTLIYGLRARQRFSESALSVSVGLDARGAATRVVREGTLTLPPREGDPDIFGQVPANDRAVERLRVHGLDVAPYTKLELRAGAWAIVPGLRAGTALLETDRVRPVQGRLPPVGRSRAQLALEPRLRVAYAAAPRLRLFAASGLYHQAPEPEDLSPTFGNPELGQAHSFQISVGQETRITSSLSLESVGYYKRSRGLVARSPAPTPEVAQVLTDDGRGRSFGLQVLLRQALADGWSGWVAWTLSRSERAAGAERYRAFDTDQPHGVAAVLQRRLASGSVGARLRYAAGSPRTPVVGASYNLNAGRFEPILGATNSDRLPDFLQLDLRVDHGFELAPETRLTLYVDALNVTARRNTEEYVYSPDFRARAGLGGLPPLAIFGMRLEQ